jgi:hypothetical protein
MVQVIVNTDVTVISICWGTCELNGKFEIFTHAVEVLGGTYFLVEDSYC